MPDESIHGKWWLADDPSKRVAGTLTREDDRWVLTTVGKLPSTLPSSVGLSAVSPTTVLGKCIGVDYTLTDAYLHKVRSDGTDDAPVFSDDGAIQIWWSSSILRGGHATDDQLYERVQVRLSNLGWMWTVTGWNGGNEYTQPLPMVATCSDGSKINLGAGLVSRHGIRDREAHEQVLAALNHEHGIRLNDVETDFIAPMRSLVSIVTDQPVEVEACSLFPVGHSPFRPPYQLQAGRVVSSPDRHRATHPIITDKTIDLERFLPEWLRVAHANPVPVSVAEERASSGTVQSDLVQTVNAAEYLHRSLCPTSGKLKARLEELARSLGDEFCAWFFNGQVDNWALVSAAIRDKLSHNQPATHGLERDEHALLAVLYVTRAVIRLCLLHAAGLPGDSDLAIRLAAIPSYKALVNQTLADWSALAERYRGSFTN